MKRQSQLGHQTIEQEAERIKTLIGKSLIPPGLGALWFQSDMPPAGWSVVSAANGRNLHAVTTGAGGTAGSANHSHWLAVQSTTGRVDSGFVGTSANWGNILVNSNTAGAVTHSIRYCYTNTVSHLYSAYKVLLIEKD